MLFGKKKSLEHFSQKNIKRRFHHLLLLKRKEGLSKVSLPSRPKRFSKSGGVSLSPAARTFLLFAILVGLFVFAAYTVFFSSFFTISKITLEKNGNAVSATSLSPFLDKLKGKNILFVSTDSLTHELEQTFKNEVLLVHIRASYPNRLVFKVDEYPAVLNVHVIAPEKEQQFVINNIGYAILENVPQKELPTLDMRVPKPFAPRSILIEPEKLTPIITAFTKFQEIFRMKVPAGTYFKIEREVRLLTQKKFSVWLDLTSPIEPQLLKLKRALPKLDIYNEPLEYIDLRIAGAEAEKVIFKRRSR